MVSWIGIVFALAAVAASVLLADATATSEGPSLDK